VIAFDLPAEKPAAELKCRGNPPRGCPHISPPHAQTLFARKDAPNDIILCALPPFPPKADQPQAETGEGALNDIFLSALPPLDGGRCPQGGWG